ncbi:hypothetical protein A8L51_13050 [Pantoea stewartii]|nr:hypothetical protein HA47_00080 [Pantoea stewartii subsp. indologenes]KTS26221.1 hypothetical protein NS381_17030 [Pantoea stewartii]NRH24708.1 hypothetical protein [Pantoea stewartii]
MSYTLPAVISALRAPARTNSFGLVALALPYIPEKMSFGDILIIQCATRICFSRPIRSLSEANQTKIQQSLIEMLTELNPVK